MISHTFTEDDLIRVLTEPKNALVRQYQKLFELDKVTLRFTQDALYAVARLVRRADLRRSVPTAAAVGAATMRPIEAFTSTTAMEDAAARHAV